MSTTGKFLLAALVWATGIFLLLLLISMATHEPPSVHHFLQWSARALGLAAFPAGITVAAEAFAGPWRQGLRVLVAACAVGGTVFALLAVVLPLASPEARSMPQLLEVMRAVGGSWQARNDAAWDFYTSFLSAINAILFALIGLQVGLWADRALPAWLRRPVYWIVGLGLLISGFAVFDTTYETVVLYTAADAPFAAFYTVLIPASICAGLALPTLARLRAGSARNMD